MNMVTFLTNMGGKPPAGLHSDKLIAHYAPLKLPPLVRMILKKLVKRLDAPL